MKKKQILAPVLLLCVALTVILLAFLYLRFAPNSTPVRFAQPNTASELAGFTISGRAGDNKYHQRFLLENGTLQTEFTLKSMYADAAGSDFSGWGSVNWMVDPAVSDSVESRARFVHADQYVSQCDSFVSMIKANLADGTSVLFPYGKSYQSKEPLQVTSVAGGAYDMYTVLNGYEGSHFENAPPSGPRVYVVFCQGKSYVCVSGEKDIAPALYLVKKSIKEADTPERTRKLVQGRPPSAAFEPYGEIEKIAEFPLGSYVKAMDVSQGMLVIGLMQKGEAKIELLQTDGTVADSIKIVTGLEQYMNSDEDLEKFMIKLPNKQSSDEICFLLSSQNFNVNIYGAARVQEGKVTATCVAQGPANTPPNEFGEWREFTNLQVMTLREDNQAILVVSNQYYRMQGEYNNVYDMQNAIVLSAYENGKSEPYAENLLVCNQQNDQNMKMLYSSQVSIEFVEFLPRQFLLGQEAEAVNNGTQQEFLHFRF